MKKLSLFLLILCALAAALGSNVIADTSNDVSANVTIGGEAPTVGAITCIDADPFTLSAETTKLLNCSATITDLNGYEDIDSVNGFFYSSATVDDGADTRDNYENGTCYLTTGSGTTREAECTFTVWYHANPTDWTVYFNATAGNDNVTNTTTITVDSLIALNVTETEIDFGSVDLDGTSDQVNITIKNTGNVVIDLSINESVYNGYMNCTDIASDDIQTDAASTGVRYNTTDAFTFDDTVSNLTDTSPSFDFNLAEADGSGSPTATSDDLYWLIKLPATGLTGSCSTTVRISATAN